MVEGLEINFDCKNLRRLGICEINLLDPQVFTGLQQVSVNKISLKKNEGG
jgi:hypothetical protein